MSKTFFALARPDSSAIADVPAVILAEFSAIDAPDAQIRIGSWQLPLRSGRSEGGSPLAVTRSRAQPKVRVF
jgi:hypothetical protein